MLAKSLISVMARTRRPDFPEVLEVRADKPITRLRTTVTNQAGTLVLDGNALVWTEPLSDQAEARTRTLRRSPMSFPRFRGWKR